MIDPNLRFEGFDARTWTNLLALFAPGIAERVHAEPSEATVPEVEAGDEVDRARGSLVIVVSASGQVLKAWHTSRGRVRHVQYSGPSDLARLRRELGARRSVVLREGALEEIAEQVAQRLTPGQDYLAQWLVLAQAVRESIDRGQIHLSPRPFASVPIPTAATVERALDLVLPDGHAMSLMLWEGSVVWTAAVLSRRGGHIDLLAGPDRVGQWTGPLGGDFRRDHRVVTEAVAAHVAPVHFGIYAEARTVRTLLEDYEPGAWAKAVAVRDVILQPMPPYVGVALGADVARAAARRSAAWLGGIDALAQLAPVARYVRGRIGEVASITATLGFDPLKLLSLGLKREESDPGDDRGPASASD